MSALNVPETPFWYAHIDNLTELTNNAVHRVVVTATDAAGNVGTNLNSKMPGDDSAQGPIVFIHDRTAPVANAILVTNEQNQPLGPHARQPQMDYILWANVSDAPFTDLNVMSLHHVKFEYTPNNGGVWLDLDTDSNPLNGQWHVSWTPENGMGDGYDNDGDGLWDEDDEIVSTVKIRVIAVDDGMNSTYSDRQNLVLVLTLTVDAAEPIAALTTPQDGEVFAYTDALALSGTAEGDYIPAFATNDVAEVRFQAKINRYYFVDNVYNGVGHAGYYDNGIDEVWFDTDGDGTWNTGDVVKFRGQDGTTITPTNAAVNYWFDLDPTPQDNSDFPRLTDANGPSDTWNMTWTPAGFSFITADELGGDEYVRLRMLSKDTAGNWDTEADLYGPKETLVVLNDNTVTRAT
ncbi:MAG: hypothetical protein MZV65_29015 [Chromatiales bacterium]|nr:hypothetical protein [Chromatiales bacterium]